MVTSTGTGTDGSHRSGRAAVTMTYTDRGGLAAEFGRSRTLAEPTVTTLASLAGTSPAVLRCRERRLTATATATAAVPPTAPGDDSDRTSPGAADPGPAAPDPVDSAYGPEPAGPATAGARRTTEAAR